MRKKAKKILFQALKFEGAEQVLFSNGKITDQNALIEIIIDAMEKFSNLDNRPKNAPSIEESISLFLKQKEEEHSKHNLFIEVVGKKLHIGNFTEHSTESVETIDLG